MHSIPNLNAPDRQTTSEIQSQQNSSGAQLILIDICLCPGTSIKINPIAVKKVSHSMFDRYYSHSIIPEHFIQKYNLKTKHL